MKNLLYHRFFVPHVLLAAAVLMFVAGCEDEKEGGAPIISEVRNYAASPDDTLVHTLTTGQWVVIMGKNLGAVSEVYFGNTRATINPTLLTDGSIVVQVPTIPFQLVPKEKLNNVTVFNSNGIASFDVNIVGPPLIMRVRNFAPAPNDTLLDAIVPGQVVNIIGFNITGATRIAFQGLNADLNAITYTDSSVVVKVPDDFSGADPGLANKITYVTPIGSGTFSIKIYDPALLAYYSDPIWTMLTGGIGKEKTWVIDFNAEGVSKKFNGPIFFSGVDWSWGNQCGTPGGDCWLWDPTYQSWMPGPKDYGTMTFKLKGNPIDPVVTVVQKGLGDDAKNGTFSGSYFLDLNTKTITFTDVVPLNMGWDQIWTKAYVISLTDTGMQLAFKHTSKSEFEIYNYIPK